MKFYTHSFVILHLILSSPLQAQKPETLLSEEMNARFAWSLDWKTGSIQKRVGTSVGLTLGALYDNALFAGFSFGANLTHTRLNHGYAGIFTQYFHQPTKLVHWNAQLLVAFAGIKDYEKSKSGLFDNFANVFGAGFLIVEPSAGLELNLTRTTRLGTSLGYRAASGIDSNHHDVSRFRPTNGDLSGLIWNLNFRFE